MNDRQQRLWLMVRNAFAALILSIATSDALASKDARTLVGQDETATLALLGKPMGRMATAAGPLWVYSDWRVQFDKGGKVLSAERDLRLSVTADPQTQARLQSQDTAKRQKALADANSRVHANRMAEAASGSNIRVVSNGGQEVDLQSLLPEGKITVVDFYADWCGPCRVAGPELERLVKDDPNFALVKIDIVKWGTPVAKQFKLPSIPNMRVFDRKKQQVGESTSDFIEVSNRMIEIRDGKKAITGTAVRVSPASK